jgi:hypothetical protein
MRSVRLEPNVVAGLQMFARYAYPPNLRGYCGPADHQAMLEYGSSGEVDPGLLQLAESFTGPWPYLTLIAAASGIADPFDRRVVEAYWVGNSLLEGIDVTAFGSVLDERFRGRAGSRWEQMSEAIGEGIVPHHAFHVFGVYPWVGLLTESDRGEPLRILEGCRIRWGRVVEASVDSVVVRSRPLTWDGSRLDLGPPRLETATLAAGGLALMRDPQPGEWVALHWDWVCDRISDRQLAALRRYTRLQLDITNERVAHPGPAMIIG